MAASRLHLTHLRFLYPAAFPVRRDIWDGICIRKAVPGWNQPLPPRSFVSLLCGLRVRHRALQQSAPLYRGWAGERNTSAAFPISTNLSQIHDRDPGRSHNSPLPGRVPQKCRSGSAPSAGILTGSESAAWMDTSSALTGSSQTRNGDLRDNAFAIPILLPSDRRKIHGVPAQHVFWKGPPYPECAPAPFPPLPLWRYDGRAWAAREFHKYAFWDSERNTVLKHHLKLRPDFLHLLWLRADRSFPSYAMIPSVGLSSPTICPADGGFAASPTLPPVPQRLPLPGRKSSRRPPHEICPVVWVMIPPFMG